MVSYITKAQLESAARATFSESLVRKAETASVEGSTFLSHSTKDSSWLPGVIKILQDHGANVYTDKGDNLLPEKTSSTTGDMLRRELRQSKKFILFATKNSKDSKWVPWELGLADGYKSPSNMAVFPGVDSETDTQWTEQEYLGLYDRVVAERVGSQENFYVMKSSGGEKVSLRSWLAR
jgi:hypothetical protein